MVSMKEIISSPLLLTLVIVGLLYIVGFSLVYLKKSYTRCLELGISKEDVKKVIKSSVVFSIVPSLSIVVGLFALISVLGVVWSWWRLSVIGSLTLGLFASSNAGKKVVKNGIMGVVPVIVIVSVLAIIVRVTSGGSLFGMIGFLIIFMLPIAIISSRIMWKKGVIKVVDQEELTKADTEE